MVWPLNKNKQWTLVKNYAKLQLSRKLPQRPSEKPWLDNTNNDTKSLKINVELAFEQNKWRKATQKKTYSLKASNPR